MIQIYDSNYNLLTQQDIHLYLSNRKLTQNVDSLFDTFTFTVYRKIAREHNFFNYLVNNNLLKINGQYFIIENIQEDNTTEGIVLKITCSHIASKLKNLYWDNEFDNTATIPFEEGITCYAGFIYIYNNKYYKCLSQTEELEDFLDGDFIEIPNFVNNYMQTTNPKKILEVLLNYGINKEYHNFKLGNFVDVVEYDFTIKSNSTYADILKQITDLWGYEFYFDNNIIHFGTRGQTKEDIKLEYKKTNISISKTTDISKVYNRIFATGKNGLTVESIINRKYVEDKESINKYGLKVKRMNFDTADEFTLIDLMYAELKETKEPYISYSVKSLKNKNIEIGDFIYVIDTELNINNLLRVVSLNQDPYSGTLDLVLNKKGKTAKTIIQQERQNFYSSISNTQKEIEELKKEPLKNSNNLLKDVVEKTKEILQKQNVIKFSNTENIDINKYKNGDIIFVLKEIFFNKKEE